MTSVSKSSYRPDLDAMICFLSKCITPCRHLVSHAEEKAVIFIEKSLIAP